MIHNEKIVLDIEKLIICKSTIIYMKSGRTHSERKESRITYAARKLYYRLVKRWHGSSSYLEHIIASVFRYNFGC